MSDLEGRLREALASTAARAPVSHDLSAGARTRARERRRAMLAGAAAVALAALMIPAAAVLGGSDDVGPGPGPPQPSPSPPASTSALPSGWRLETWRDLEVRVPTHWGYGAPAAWCADGSDVEAPVVQRPSTVVPTIHCKAPRLGHGLQFLEPGVEHPGRDGAPGTVRRTSSGTFPHGSWLGYATGVHADVIVAAPTEYVARYVLDSFRAVPGLDGNGCPTTHDTTAPPDPSGRMSVCRYTEDGWLEQSELLSPAETDQAFRAVERAPETAYAPPCRDTPESGEVSQFVVLLSARARMTVVWQGSECADRGVIIDGRERRELTEDVMYWALSPGWSGGIDVTVPLPSDLRR